MSVCTFGKEQYVNGVVYETNIMYGYPLLMESVSTEARESYVVLSWFCGILL